MPATARAEAERLGLDPDRADLLTDPATNLRLGASYLARLLRRFDGHPAFALAAYNAGPTAVERWRARAPDASPLEVVLREGYEETRRHVLRVLAWEAHYRGR
jgi:soluble lytic murein transglycosylase